MIEFRVQDMTCNHCAGAITQAVKGMDPQASLNIDLEQHLVRIESQVNPQALQSAITEAGYSPELLAS